MLDFMEQAERGEKSIVEAIKEIFPYKGQKRTLIADRVWVEHVAGNRTDFKGQKDVKVKGGTWASPIYAKIRLIDNESGKVIDKVEKIKLVNLPVATPRGSYIVSGSEYQVPNQLRLKPGVYTRIQENGELESQVNLAKGMNFKLHVNPNTEIFYLTFGTTNIQLYHVLTSFGVTRQQIEAVWGPEITEKNAKKGIPDTEISKLYKSIFRTEPKDYATSVTEIQSYFSDNKIDKETTEITLGRGFSNVTSDLLLRTSAKIIAVSRGEDKADDRDSMEFKNILSVDDFLKERISKNAWKVRVAIRRNIDRRDSIREIIGLSTFNRPIQSFFTLGDTGLSSTTEQTNPLHMVSETDKVITTGAGGITNPHAITLEARSVHPSSMGFIDPLATPESSRIGTTLHLPLGAIKKGNKLYTSMYDVKTNKIVQIDSKQMAASTVSSRDQYNVKSGKLKPKSATVKAAKSGTITLVSAKEVDYIIPTPQSLFSVQSNMIPFLASDQGNRAMMAGKMMTQALPLINREKPRVQVVAGRDMTFEKVVGEGFSSRSPASGTIISVDDEKIVIKDNAGKKHSVPIYTNFPLNSKTGFIDSEMRVNVGDKVKKGQLIADTNFTKDGELSLGINAIVAFLPHKGYNFEDGISVSESFAHKATSSHLYKISIQLDSNTTMDLNKFKAYYPEVLDIASTARLDSSGVIKKGQKVKLGDIIMSVLKKEEKGPEDIVLARLHRAFIKPYKNRSVEWEEEDEGTVVDVIKTAKKIEVHIRTEETAKIGDKLSGRHGNKGTITAVINDGEMPTDEKGRTIDVMLNPHGVPSRINPGQIWETIAGKISEKTGKQFQVRNFSGENYIESIEKALKKAGLKDKEDLFDPVSNKKIPGVLVGSQYMLKLDHPTRKKFSARAQGPGYTSDLQPSRGKHVGGQSLDTLTLYSMLAHGSLHNLREMSTWKCFVRRQFVETDQGPIDIAKIVNEKMSVKVLTQNKDGALGFGKITNYWKKALNDQLVSVKVMGISEDGVYRSKKIICTEGHKFFLDSGAQEKAKNLEGKNLQSMALLPNKAQRSLVVGSVLGDGYLNKHDHYFASFQENHCVEQEEYLRLKSRVLNKFSNVDVSEPRPNSGYGDGKYYVSWHTLAQPWMNDLHEEFYGSSGKRITDAIASWIDPLALAIWYCDDGSCVRKSGRENSYWTRISTYGYDRESLKIACSTIDERFGVKFKIDSSGCIGVYGDSKKFQELISPYVPKCMSYKVPCVDLDSVGTFWNDDYSEPVQGTVSVPVISVTPHNPTSNDGRHLYNLEVDGDHRYFVSGILVANSERNDEVWRALQLGQALPAPQAPFAFEKFIGTLKGLGIDVKKEGNNLVLAPMTDREIKNASAGEIKNGQVVRGKDFKPEKGGLFDPKITGGLSGDQWNHIELAEPMPNPIFENSIKFILGITQTIYDDLIAGRRWVTPEGKITTVKADDSITGGVAIKALLAKIDVDKKLEGLIEQAKGKKGAELDKMHKTIRYLKALQRYKLKPTDYVVNRVPVIPARLRPVYALPDGQLNVTEVNYLYKDLIEINNQQKDFTELGMPQEDKSKLRETLYKGMKAVVGLHPHLGGRSFKGIIEQIKGPQNKEGFFQNRIMSRRQEFSGRSTIVPEPSLGLDDVAIPEEMAWKIYQPFVVRELIRQGYKPIDAREEVEKRSELAKRALMVAIEDRPVMLNRAPSLHKFSMMAFNTQITTGKAIKINPLVVNGFNADFDGDTMAVHVPISEDARLEALKMLPSHNLYSPRSNELMNTPTQEAVTGLYLLTQNSKGRAEVNATLPDAKYHIKEPMTKKTMSALLKRISKESPGSFVKVVNTFKDLGNKYAYKLGFTVGLEDLKGDNAERNRIFKEADAEVKKAGGSPDAIVAAYTKAAQKLDNALLKNKKLRANGFMIMANSGAKGNIGQIRQILSAPVLVRDVHDNPVPVPIKKSYAEGLDLLDYWASMAGARKGMIDRALQTAEPGALSKELLNTTVSHIISEEDCGTKKGLDISIDSLDILDRYLSSYTKGVGTRNQIVTYILLKKAKLAGHKTLKVRSPLTCESTRGTCRKCFGLDETGGLPKLGTNIGVIAGQAIAEPATQMTMRTFHTGGAVGGGGGITAGFERIKELLEIPRILRGKATLAQEKGKVDEIKESPLGGWDVFIGKNKHRVPKQRLLLIEKGQSVDKGQPISDGVQHPQEILRLKGMRAAQKYLVDQIQKEYASQGVGVKRKIIESVIKPLTSTVRVLDPGAHPTYVPGDHAPYNMVEKYNQEQGNENRRIIAEPILRGINTAPLMSEDWLQRLNFQRLKDTLLEGPSQAWSSPISSPYSPLSAFAYGAEIGRESP